MADPIMLVKIHKDVAEVTVGGKEKIVSIEDFSNALSSNLGLLMAKDKSSVSKTDVMQTPKSFVCCISKNDGYNKRVFLYQEERRSDLTLDISSMVATIIPDLLGIPRVVADVVKYLQNIPEESGVIYSERDGHKLLTFKKCALPNFLCSMTLDRTKGADVFGVTRVKYDYTAIPREAIGRFTAETTEWSSVCKTEGRIPFPNFYSGNTMCYGQNSIIPNVPASDNNYRPLESYLALITSSPFNSDLWEGMGNHILQDMANRSSFSCIGEGSDADKKDRVTNSFSRNGRSAQIPCWFYYLSKVESFPYTLVRYS